MIAGDNLELKAKYEVIGTPTSIILKADGNEVDRTLGYVRTAEFISTVEDYWKGKGTLAALLLDEPKMVKDPDFMYKLGEKLTAHNRSDDADARFAAVVTLDPDNKKGNSDDALLERSWLCRKKENYKCAVAHSEDCLKRWPKGEMADDALINVAWYSFKDGDKAKSAESFKKYIAQYPQGEDIDFAKEKLAEIEKEATAGSSGGSN